MLNYYRIATQFAAPFLPLWLHLRMLKGKEDRGRLRERYGYSNYGRPKGTLLWIHAASVGEANSVLALIQRLKEQFPSLGILLTTGTVTSAALMKQRLPQGVLHQYAPVDTPQATRRFIQHWLPDVAWFVESELWPNLIHAARERYCLMALINARMSERSFYRWKKYLSVAQDMLGAFQICFAQGDADASRLKALGAKNVVINGNIKYDAPPLPCNEAELLSLQGIIGSRPLWLAASTHPGEEIMVAQAHQRVLKSHLNLLTIIVPRHPARGADIARELGAFGAVSVRSLNQPIAPDTAFYIADTLGELGLFYRLCDIAFMGGSLVIHGGQNPLEPAQLACAIISGPYVHNFHDIYYEMQQARVALLAMNSEQLASHVEAMLDKPSLKNDMQDLAKAFVQQKTGASEAIIDMFAPVLAK